MPANGCPGRREGLPCYYLNTCVLLSRPQRERSFSKFDTMINRKIISLFSFCFLLGTGIKAQPHQGDIAAEIPLTTFKGNYNHLSILKGNVVLLVFLDSSCEPCRAENRDLVKLYPKYKNKGFEIFSVSIDDSKEDWEKAIKKDKISWLQVNQGGGWYAPTAVSWSIDAIPTTFLIDKEGRLIAMDLERKDLEKALKDMLAD